MAGVIFCGAGWNDGFLYFLRHVTLMCIAAFQLLAAGRNQVIDRAVKAVKINLWARAYAPHRLVVVVVVKVLVIPGKLE